jgi:hypothetical protein
MDRFSFPSRPPSNARVGSSSGPSKPGSSANTDIRPTSSSSSSANSDGGGSGAGGPNGAIAPTKAATSEAEQFIRKAIGSQQTFADWRTLIHTHLEKRAARHKDAATAAAAAAAAMDEEAEVANAASNRQVSLFIQVT